ncbi:MAG: PEP-CTERM-box response regulator transcription factor, partial [Deltaproteobacteria bacterium]|nr:PEP-CTERM-box response regulator transcription factor [Deltaproteobacteria bacterium]
MEKPKLLIVEDNSSIATQMKWALAQDYEVLLAENRPNALELFKKERPPVVTLDLGLPPQSGGVEEGFLALSGIKENDPSAKVIVITGQDQRENALEAIARGAYDFFSKPIQIEELKIILHRAYYLFELEREHRELQERLKVEPFEEMIGTSPQIQAVFNSIRKVATSDAPVLIAGESGTGKELTARAIHRLSNRKNGPFVAINCSAIPETLLESELFGHEKGAFTGAHIQRKGRFETAHEGTLFLDEIGDLPGHLQVKLLRFLQEQKIERIGGREEISVDVRIIAASNRDLKEAMKDGRFREDLYYRIGVVVVLLPPLREREGDILVLATALLQRYSLENKRNVIGFTPQAIRAIKTYHWPGNIREIENRIKRAVIMAEGSKITPHDLELASPFEKYEGKGLKEAREELERDFIQKALLKHKGNISK